MNVKQITTVNRELNIIGATLLSEEEAKTLLTKEERVYKSYWWLRTPGRYGSRACSIDYDGDVRSYSFVYYSNRGVRPALVLSDISDSNFKVGDIFEVAGYKFKVLSQTLAWMYEQDIGKLCFNEKTNIYEESSVKKFVDEWFENLTKEE